ncbi:MAG: hypothetical protein AAF827_08360 [Cyanobacteria bacterium P01_D01_bin.6]
MLHAPGADHPVKGGVREIKLFTAQTQARHGQRGLSFLQLGLREIARQGVSAAPVALAQAPSPTQPAQSLRFILATMRPNLPH